jgi:DNA-binding CsgD family transcriptional regulator
MPRPPLRRKAPEYASQADRIQRRRNRSSAAMLGRLKKSEEQVEQERRHWLAHPDPNETENLRYWREQKRNGYLSALQDAQARQATLSDMQWYVASLLSRGKPLKEISDELGVGIDRVNDLVAEIRHKAQLKDAAEIPRWFLGH